MARSLVIVESATKAPTINRYLGRDFVVKSSTGHVRDLPTRRSTLAPKERAEQRAKEAAKTRKLPPKRREEYRRQRARSQLIRNMGVDPDDGWSATYEVIPGKEKVVRELKTLASRADLVYLATDLDREGEAIAWHLMEVLGGSPDRYRRVVFNQITKNAVEEAFANPGTVDENQVNAQQARRFLDRVVGFELSPLLWSKVARGLSAGRVQSVAVRLVVEREREIRAFTPEEYWEAFADLLRNDPAAEGESAVRFQVVKENGEDFRPGNRATAEEAVARLRERPFSVRDRVDRETTTRPPPPFITSTLQQAASGRFGFSVRKTMTIAQRLYEGGFITYMRTDSTNVAPEAVAAVRTYVDEQYGKRYVPESPNRYTSKSTAQEAHEAIRPTDLAGLPASAGVDADGRRLYDLIWRRFVACQMSRAEYLATTVTASAGEFELVRRGRIVRFDGFTRVLAPLSRGDDDEALPDYAVGDALYLEETDAVQHFTRPPPRYGEASLVRELEKRGIGRPSTYVPIISTIQERGYVTLKNRRFHAERVGELVTDRLIESFPDLLDYSFTAGMEANLDEVAEGNRAWRGVLDTFYGDFAGRLESARGEDGMRANTPTPTDIPCSKCGRTMQLRTRGYGGVSRLFGLRLAPEGTLHEHPKPRAGRGNRGHRQGCGRRVQAAPRQAQVRDVRYADGQLPDRPTAQVAHLRQQPRLSGLRGRTGRVPAQGLRGAGHRMRQVRCRDAVAFRAIRQVLRLHGGGLLEYPQALAQRPAGAAQGRSRADAGVAVHERGRPLRPARRRCRHFPGGQPVSQAPGDPGAPDRRTEGAQQ